MTPRIDSVAAPARRAHSRFRAGTVFALALVPLLGACGAVARTAPAPLELRQADGAVWVRASDQRSGARVVLSGAPVYVLSGERELRGDTLYVKTPFAIGIPEGAFELTVEAQRPRGPARAASPVAELRFTAIGGRGTLESVRAEGSRLVLRRHESGGALAVDGARRVETRAVSAIAGR